MDAEDILRGFGPAVLAVLASWVVDHITLRRGLRPPGFATPGGASPPALVAATFYAGVFSPLGNIGLGLEVDYGAVHPAQLFGLHALLVATVAVWYLLAFAGVAEAGDARRRWIAQFGLRTARPGWELGLACWRALRPGRWC
jgi:hypothetical protein